MEKKDRSKWTNKFRSLGKKKGSRQDFVNIYKEMKKKIKIPIKKMFQKMSSLYSWVRFGHEI